jgi:hypothetical protein
MKLQYAKYHDALPAPWMLASSRPTGKGRSEFSLHGRFQSGKEEEKGCHLRTWSDRTIAETDKDAPTL